MSCPSDESRLAALLGELSVNQARALAAHRVGCAACRQALLADEQLLADLAAAPELPQSEPAFTASVMAACRAAPLAQPRPRTRQRNVETWSAALALAACAAALSVALPWSRRASDFQARGVSAAHAPAVSAEVLFVRDAVFHPVLGARLREGDALAVRYTNRGDVPRYLAVFALDARRELHWIYPAYVDAAANPGSVILAPDARDKLLSEVVEPEAPAAGELRVFALVTDAAVHVKEVEALPRRQLSAERLEAFFPSAKVQTWGATWVGK